MLNYSDKKALFLNRVGANQMGGRFGKYGDTKRKAKLRQSGIVRTKGEKVKPDPKRLRRQKKKQSDKSS